MGDLFESRGMDATVMTDSQAALDLFSQEPTAFDLMITDQTMPGLTGVELSQKVLELRPEMPVILCTGYSEHVDEAKAKAMGIRGYLTKPMEINTLLTLVQSLIV
jgi:CheY-like chemotaxis protein